MTQQDILQEARRKMAVRMQGQELAEYEGMVAVPRPAEGQVSDVVGDVAGLATRSFGALRDMPRSLPVVGGFVGGVEDALGRAATKIVPYFGGPEDLPANRRRQDEIIREMGFDPNQIRQGPATLHQAPYSELTAPLARMSQSRLLGLDDSVEPDPSAVVQARGDAILQLAQKIEQAPEGGIPGAIGRVAGSIVTGGASEEPISVAEARTPLMTALSAFPPAAGVAAPLGAAARPLFAALRGTSAGLKTGQTVSTALNRALSTGFGKEIPERLTQPIPGRPGATRSGNFRIVDQTDPETELVTDIASARRVQVFSKDGEPLIEISAKPIPQEAGRVYQVEIQPIGPASPLLVPQKPPTTLGATPAAARAGGAPSAQRLGFDEAALRDAFSTNELAEIGEGLMKEIGADELVGFRLNMGEARGITRSQIESLLGPSLRVMEDLQTAEELGKIAFKDDSFRRLGNTAGIKWINEFINPAAVASNPGAYGGVMYRNWLSDGKTKAVGSVQRLFSMGEEKSIFPQDAKGFLSGPGFEGRNVTLNMVREAPTARYKSLLDNAQRDYIAEMRVLEDSKLDLLLRNDIDIKVLPFEEGGQFAGRRWWGKEVDGEFIEFRNIEKPGARSPGAKLISEFKRTLDSEEEGIRLGFVPLSQTETLFLNIQGAYNRVAGKMLEDYLFTNVQYRTTGAYQSSKAFFRSATQRVDALTKTVKALNQRMRGEQLEASTERMFARTVEAFPELEQGFFVQAGREGRAPALGVIPNDNVKGIRDFINAFLLPEARERARIARQDRAVSAARNARERIREARLDLPFGRGKFITHAEAQTIKEDLEKAVRPYISNIKGTLTQKVARTVTNVNLINRMFMLSADASSLFIQLLFLSGENPIIWKRSAEGFFKALRSPTFLNKYMAENASVVQQQRKLILGGGDMTEAAQRGGLLYNVPIIRESARAFDASMTVAGIEMWKAKRHLMTTPERQDMVEAFINEFRGLANPDHLGLSAEMRFIETNTLLAPRYNRAIATLLADLARGNLRGEQARRALGKGVLAVTAMSYAVSLARGESPTDALEHFDPRSNKFYSWDIAGQNIGPGTKVRSVVKLLGRTFSDPTDLLNLSGNPALKFVQGNLAGAPSATIDIINGSNYVGDATRGNALDLLDNVAAPRLMPIWVKSAFFEGGDLQGRIIRGAVEGLGGRANAFSGYDISKRLAHKIGREFDDMEPFEKAIMREMNAEDLMPLLERKANGGDRDAEYWVQITALREETAAELQALTMRIFDRADPLFGTRNRTSAIRNEYRTIMTRSASTRTGIDRAFEKYQGDVDVDHDNNDKVARSMWYEAYEEAERADGSLDFLKLQALQIKVLQHYPGSEAYIVRNTHMNPPPDALIHFLPVTTQNNIRKANQAREKFIAENWSNP